LANISAKSCLNSIVNKEKILEEFSFDKKGELLRIVLKMLMLVLIVIALGVYIGDLLFGKNSLEVLLNLQEKKGILKEQIANYKKKNAILQKEYFELLQLEPTDN